MAVIRRRRKIEASRTMFRPQDTEPAHRYPSDNLWFVRWPVDQAVDEATRCSSGFDLDDTHRHDAQFTATIPSRPRLVVRYWRTGALHGRDTAAGSAQP